VSKDEILQALRLTAMGRTGHPLQEELADALAGLFATPEQRAASEMAEAGIEPQPAKRGPGRPKKAD
jgi:hypothetical protein